jgi:branched-chain amino acid transport system ATP-binding protein
MTLSVENISKSFGGLRVLESISISMDRERLTGIVGPNGAGKSTFFALISGFEACDTGAITFEGKEITALSSVSRARLGLVRTFQVPRPFTHLTVRENLLVAAPRQSGERIVDLFARPWHVRARDIEIGQKADELIEFLRLGRVAKEKAGKLSGGQLKLLELGRALMVQPKFILLDEPFAGVNAVLIDEISDRIRVLNGRGIGFLIIEHNLAALSELCESLVVLDRGRLIASGGPNEVLSNPDVQAAYIGGP